MHKLIKRLYKTVTVICLAASSIAFAEQHTSSTHGAHVHGYAQLTLAIEGNKLMINLTAPAQSLVGFEHRAETPEEVTQINQLEKTLANVDNVLTLTIDSCKTIDQTIDMHDLLPLENHNNHQHDHSSHTSHAEVVADYTLECHKLSDISSATVNIFTYFSAIEKVKALWITNSQQGAENLTADHKVIAWR